MKTIPWWGTVAIVSAGMLGGDRVGATPILKEPGWTYVSDGFASSDVSAQRWTYASCNATSHQVADGALYKFPTLGQASRPGQCVIAAKDSSSYMQFTTMPFDRRDADDEFGTENFCVKDELGTPRVYTVDPRKGGSEMRSNQSSPGYLYDGKTSFTGWDTYGQNYLTASNTVMFTWVFRLKDISMLRSWNGIEPMATSAVVGQFHAQDYKDLTKGIDCGEYKSGYSPSPGLEVSVVPVSETNPTELVHFKLSTKLKKSQLPQGACDAEPCDYEMWSADFPLERVSGESAPWIAVEYIMRPSSTNGALKFGFGVKSLHDEDLAFKYRTLTGPAGGTEVLAIPMTQNNCPNRPFLGAYVLGYPLAYYGGVLPHGSVCRDQTDSPRRNDHMPTPSSWVSTKFDREELLKRYIVGVTDKKDLPPRLVVDYDNFRIVQMESLP